MYLDWVYGTEEVSQLALSITGKDKSKLTI